MIKGLYLSIPCSGCRMITLQPVANVADTPVIFCTICGAKNDSTPIQPLAKELIAVMERMRDVLMTD